MHNKKLIPIIFLLILFSWSCAEAQQDDWSYSFNLEAAGKYVQAAQVIEKYLQDSEDKEFAQLRSGWLYYLAGEYNRSAQHYQTALKINGQSLEARLGLMLPLMAQQRWREAAQQANEVIAASKWNYFAHVRLMACEEALGLWDELVKHANQVQVRFPADANVLVYLARGYAGKDRSEEAKAVYRKVLHRVPGHIEAMEYLSR